MTVSEAVDYPGGRPSDFFSSRLRRRMGSLTFDIDLHEQREARPYKVRHFMREVL